MAVYYVTDKNGNTRLVNTKKKKGGDKWTSR